MRSISSSILLGVVVLSWGTKVRLSNFPCNGTDFCKKLGLKSSVINKDSYRYNRRWIKRLFALQNENQACHYFSFSYQSFELFLDLSRLLNDKLPPRYTQSLMDYSSPMMCRRFTLRVMQWSSVVVCGGNGYVLIIIDNILLLMIMDGWDRFQQ